MYVCVYVSACIYASLYVSTYVPMPVCLGLGEYSVRSVVCIEPWSEFVRRGFKHEATKLHARSSNVAHLGS